MKISVGSDNFYKIVKEEALIVDKTRLIKEIIENSSEVILFTRPRRWGKTLNMSMLECFFSPTMEGKETKGLFDKFEIAKIEGGKYIKEHQGKYPVIFISFKEVRGKDFNTCLRAISVTIGNLYDQFFTQLKEEERKKFGRLPSVVYDELFKNSPDPTLVAHSIKVLSQCLYEYHGSKQGVYILIDEYDKPLNAAYGKKHFDELSEFMRSLLGAALKSNAFLKQGIMTGILRISKGKMLSSLNNLREFTLLDEKFAPYFGFTDEEVNQLFQKSEIKIDIQKVKEWFNGYKVNELVIYNPWSIMSCLDEGNLRAYWVDTADDSLIKETLMNASSSIKDQLLSLIEGKTISVEINKHVTFERLHQNETGLWSLLVFAGYLCVEKAEFAPKFNLYECTLRIPNKEVLSLYNQFMIDWFAQRLGGEHKYRLFITKLLKGDVDGFGKDLGDYLLKCSSIHDMAQQPEAFYHGFVLALLASIQDDYIISSNKESGLGYYDIAIIPKQNLKSDLGIILEFKHAKKNQDIEEVAKGALKQIDKYLYETEIQKHTYIKHVLKVGMAFSGKSVVYASKTTTFIEEKESDSEVTLSPKILTAEDFDQEEDEYLPKSKEITAVKDSKLEEQDKKEEESEEEVTLKIKKNKKNKKYIIVSDEEEEKDPKKLKPHSYSEQGLFKQTTQSKDDKKEMAPEKQKKF